MNRQMLAARIAAEFGGAERQIARTAALRALPNGGAQIGIGRAAAKKAVEEYRAGGRPPGSPGAPGSTMRSVARKEFFRSLRAAKDHLRDCLSEDSDGCICG